MNEPARRTCVGIPTQVRSFLITQNNQIFLVIVGFAIRRASSRSLAAGIYVEYALALHNAELHVHAALTLLLRKTIQQDQP